ncbi:MAG: malonate transporter subunit MadM [Pseudomonadota bacterium]|jgi:malonate transporter MadM subunit
MWELCAKALAQNGLITAFALVGLITVVAEYLSKRLTGGRIHASAIAISIGLVFAYVGGHVTGGSKGLADVATLGGIGLMGSAMLRDFSIVATAFEVDPRQLRRAGWLGLSALLLGVLVPFTVGVVTARLFGYTDPAVLTTIGAGAVTYIVGPVTGAALGVSSDIMALSVSIGLLKALIVMIGTPMAARALRLNTPRAAIVFGGLAGTVSGVTAGLAATDRRLVPYGALVATFHTGVGCLLCPSVLFLTVQAFTRP